MLEKIKYPYVLVVDDDSFLIGKALKAGGVENPVHFLKDGQALIDYLNEYLKISGTENGLPALILMDINMPRMDGFEALKILKSYVRLTKIPVVMLSNSNDPKDIARSTELGANSFYTKPLDYLELINLIRLLKSNWLHNVPLPSDDNGQGNFGVLCEDLPQ